MLSQPFPNLKRSLKYIIIVGKRLISCAMNGVCIMKHDPSRFGHIIQLFTVLLTAILISLFFAVLVMVG